MHIKPAFKSNLVVAQLVLGIAIAGAQSYSVSPINLSGVSNATPYSINDQGAITGGATVNSGYSAFVWSPLSQNGSTGTTRVLTNPKGYNSASGRGINSAGDVAGTGGKQGRNGSWSTLPHALLWQGSSAPLIVGPTSNVQSEGLGINDAGQVLVWHPAAASDRSVAISMFVGGTRQLVAIGGGYPSAINASGQVSVRYGDPSGPGFVWTPSTPNGPTGTKTFVTDAGFLYGINDPGEVATSRRFHYAPRNQMLDRPAIYLPTAAHGFQAGLNDLPFPSTPPPAGDWFLGFATDINNLGTAIGNMKAYDMSDPVNPSLTLNTEFVWDSTNGMRDLNQVIAGSGWSVVVAIDINNAGQILAKGRYLGGPEVVILLNPS